MFINFWDIFLNYWHTLNTVKKDNMKKVNMVNWMHSDKNVTRKVYNNENIKELQNIFMQFFYYDKILI